MATTVAGYLRCSTDLQDVGVQRQALMALASARGWAPVWFEDQAVSGVKERPELERLLEQARQGKIAVIMVWAIDRLGRSMHEVIGILLELDRVGARVVSHQEPWLDTSGPVRSLLIAIFSWVAEQERARMIERTKAGMEHAKKFGTRSGRPIGRPEVGFQQSALTAAEKMREEGYSWREIAAAIKTNTRSIRRAMQAAGQV